MASTDAIAALEALDAANDPFIAGTVLANFFVEARRTNDGSAKWEQLSKIVNYFDGANRKAVRGAISFLWLLTPEEADRVAGYADVAWQRLTALRPLTGDLGLTSHYPGPTGLMTIGYDPDTAAPTMGYELMRVLCLTADGVYDPGQWPAELPSLRADGEPPKSADEVDLSRAESIEVFAAALWKLPSFDLARVAAYASWYWQLRKDSIRIEADARAAEDIAAVTAAIEKAAAALPELPVVPEPPAVPELPEGPTFPACPYPAFSTTVTSTTIALTPTPTEVIASYMKFFVDQGIDDKAKAAELAIKLYETLSRPTYALPPAPAFPYPPWQVTSGVQSQPQAPAPTAPPAGPTFPAPHYPFGSTAGPVNPYPFGSVNTGTTLSSADLANHYGVPDFVPNTVATLTNRGETYTQTVMDLAKAYGAPTYGIPEGSFKPHSDFSVDGNGVIQIGAPINGHAR